MKKEKPVDSPKPKSGVVRIVKYTADDSSEHPTAAAAKAHNRRLATLDAIKPHLAPDADLAHVHSVLSAVEKSFVLSVRKPQAA
jgi:hypothetical protein